MNNWDLYNFTHKKATGKSYESEFIGLIDRSITGSVTIPNGTTSIGGYAFYTCAKLTSVEIPNSVTSIGSSAFYNCTGLTNVDISNSVTSIGSSAFSGCTNLTSVDIPNSVTSIGNSAFYKCTKLTSVEIPNSVTSIDSTVFYFCSSLENVTLESGFNANNLTLSYSTKYSVETLVNMLTALADRTEQTTTYRLILGSTNLAKLTDEQKAIATDKNWTLA